jgi:hypothetical protein
MGTSCEFVHSGFVEIFSFELLLYRVLAEVSSVGFSCH